MLLVVTMLLSMFSISGFATDSAITIMVPPGVSIGDGAQFNDTKENSMTTPVMLDGKEINDYTVAVADSSIISAEKIEDGILQIESLEVGTTTLTLSTTTDDGTVSATITFNITDSSASGGDQGGGSQNSGGEADLNPNEGLIETFVGVFKWVKDGTTLTISYVSGEAKVEGYPSHGSFEEITQIVFEDGITGVTEGFFNNFSHVKDYVFAESVTVVEMNINYDLDDYTFTGFDKADVTQVGILGQVPITSPDPDPLVPTGVTPVDVGNEKVDVADNVITLEHEYWNAVYMKFTAPKDGIYKLTLVAEREENAYPWFRTMGPAQEGVPITVYSSGGYDGTVNYTNWQYFNLKQDESYIYMALIPKIGLKTAEGIWVTFEESECPLNAQSSVVMNEIVAEVEGFYDSEDEVDGVTTSENGVTIDVTNTSADDIPTTSVSIEAASVDTLNTSNVDTATIETNAAGVSFDESAIDNILDTMLESNSDKAVLTVNETVQPDGMVISLTLYTESGEAIVPESTSSENGEMTVSVPYDAYVDGNTIEVYYVTPEGMTLIDAEYDPETNTVVFSTNHFSDYKIVQKSEDGHSGAIGNSITWTYENGILTISGSGDIVVAPPEWNALEVTKVIIGEGITSICDFAFASKESLKELALPDTIESIGYQAFYNTGIEEIVIPDSVTFIDYNAFANCQSLKKVSISDNVAKVGMDTFNSCVNLEEVKLPANCTIIGVSAFYGCSSLKTIVLPDKLEEIRQDAFTGTGLTHIAIPDSVTSMLARCVGYNVNGEPITSFHICATNEVAEMYATENGMTYGHNIVVYEAEEPTCTEKGWEAYEACKLCNYTTYKEVAALGHTEVVDAAVAPTCTKTGLTEGKHCSVCDEVIVAQTVVDALGHTEVVDAAVAPTCTETGLTEGKQCSVCDEVIVAQTVVDSLGHTEVVDAAVAPTCTETGLTEGKHCSVCDEVIVAQTVVDSLGHTEVVDAAVAPTCTETGLTEGKHCSVCDEVIVAQTVVDALGHTEVVDAAVAPTCTKTGLTEGKHCSVCDTVLVKQETVKVDDHQWNEGEVTKKPSAEKVGEKIFTCSVCKTTKKEEIPALGECDGGVSCPSKHFTDVKMDWAHEGVDFVVSNKLYKGTTDTTFEPDATMTRAMLVTVLWRLEGEPAATNTTFTDLKADWYKTAVAWAAENSIVNGTGTPGIFDPTGNVTREQIATIMYRYAEYKGVDVSTLGDISGFLDADDVDSWAEKETKWAVGTGLINGAIQDGQTVLAPQDSANRAVVATIMMRFIQNVVEG